MLGFHRFWHTQKKCKGQLWFPLAPAHSLPWDSSFHFHGVGGMAWVGSNILPTPRPAQGHHAHHPPPPPPPPMLCSGLLAKMASQPYMAQRSTPCPRGCLVPHWAMARLAKYCWTVTQLLTLGSVFMPGLLPWDCRLGTVTLRLSPWDQEHLQGHQISKQTAKIHSGKKMPFKEKVFYTTVKFLLSHKAQIHILINSQVLNENPRKSITFPVISVK